MLTANLINNNIPRLQPLDSVSKALQLISDFKVTHLPVVSENKFLGLISEEDLLDSEDQKTTIELRGRCRDCVTESAQRDLRDSNQGSH